MILVSSQLNLNEKLICGSFILILNGLVLCNSNPLILSEIRFFISNFVISTLSLMMPT